MSATFGFNRIRPRKEACKIWHCYSVFHDLFCATSKLKIGTSSELLCLPNERSCLHYANLFEQEASVPKHRRSETQEQIVDSTRSQTGESGANDSLQQRKREPLGSFSEPDSYTTYSNPYLFVPNQGPVSVSLF